MHTIDEVIKAIEYCMKDGDNCPEECPFVGSCSPTSYAVKADALQHLKEYREMLNNVENEPLDWYELKQMEGKPVWVEELEGKYADSSWYIHHGTADGYDNDEILYLQPFAVFTKNTLGKTWQAYRKER